MPGCGIGGSALVFGRSLCLPKWWGSPSARSKQRAPKPAPKNWLSDGSGHRVSFEVADVLHTPFEDERFDLIWSMESGEHYPDKAQFFHESYRLLKPGGQF
jgi:tocopherol O-methyltransferase